MKTIYSTTKRALARWIRRHAAKDDWAAAGIPLNAIAPGIIRTPMVAALCGQVVFVDGGSDVVIRGDSTW